MASLGTETPDHSQAESAGDRDRWDQLFSVVYQELHTLAHAAMRNESPSHAMQTTALLHEAYVRLVKNQDQRFGNPAQFMNAAASSMRRILVDEARRRRSLKRGGGCRRVPLHDVADAGRPVAGPQSRFEDLELLDVALDQLASKPAHRRKCAQVELRFFAGLTLEQTAEVLGVSLATVKRDWDFTKAWLFHRTREMRSHE